MKVEHFYHLFCATDQWRDPLAEHLWALDKSGFDGPFHVGIVGSPKQRDEALTELNAIRPPDGVIEADEGWEQVTLHALHTHVKRKRTGHILYAHTKGAFTPSPHHDVWRRAMTQLVVCDLESVIERMGDRDAAGCRWIDADIGPHFSGNYWVATTSYLRSLKKCATVTRWDAEAWIGTGSPRVLDLHPDHVWPRVRYGRLIAGRV